MSLNFPFLHHIFRISLPESHHCMHLLQFLFYCNVRKFNSCISHSVLSRSLDALFLFLVFFATALCEKYKMHNYCFLMQHDVVVDCRKMSGAQIRRMILYAFMNAILEEVEEVFFYNFIIFLNHVFFFPTSVFFFVKVNIYFVS